MEERPKQKNNLKETETEGKKTLKHKLPLISSEVQEDIVSTRKEQEAT